MEFKKIDILNLSVDDWKTFHEFRKVYHFEYIPDEPFFQDSDEQREIKLNYAEDIKDMNYYYYWIFENNKIIGTFNFRFYKENSNKFLGNEQIVKYSIELLKKYHRRGLGTQSLAIMCNECEKYNKKVFITRRQNIYTKLFFDAIGAKVIETEIKNRLNLSTVDYDMVEKWISEGQRKNPDTNIVIIEGKIPSEYRVHFTAAFSDSVMNMPAENSALKRKEFTLENLQTMEEIDESGGLKSLYILTIEPSGLISALSNVKMVRGDNEILYQGITGVPIVFRGRKLGKLVKAKMLAYIKEKYTSFKFIITSNSEVNESMLYINNKLGFTKYKEQLTFQCTLEHLKHYLEVKNIPNLN